MITLTTAHNIDRHRSIVAVIGDVEISSEWHALYLDAALESVGLTRRQVEAAAAGDSAAQVRWGDAERDFMRAVESHASRRWARLVADLGFLDVEHLAVGEQSAYTQVDDVDVVGMGGDDGLDDPDLTEAAAAITEAWVDATDVGPDDVPDAATTLVAAAREITA